MSDIQRVRYQNNPLINVIFQLRFPTILRIGAKEPEEFQEKIMQEYPFFDESIEQAEDVKFAEGKPVPVSRQSKNYQFTSKDGLTEVNLTSDFIALSTENYIQWEFFRDQIRFVISEFEEVYHPIFYSRVGLRYQDVITRSRLGLNNKTWDDLIQPSVLGILTQKVKSEAVSFSSDAEFKEEDQTSVRTHFELVHMDGEPELSFLIDCDYFWMDITDINDMFSVAEMLHNHSETFIRSAITAELHNALDPIPINT